MTPRRLVPLPLHQIYATSASSQPSCCGDRVKSQRWPCSKYCMTVSMVGRLCGTPCQHAFNSRQSSLPIFTPFNEGRPGLLPSTTICTICSRRSLWKGGFRVYNYKRSFLVGELLLRGRDENYLCPKTPKGIYIVLIATLYGVF